MRKQNSEFLTAFTSEANTHLKNTDSFAYVELDDYACYVIADGIDDYNDAKSARLCVDSIISSFTESPSMSRRSLKRYLQVANRILLKTKSRRRLKASVTIVVHNYMKLRYAQAGNTRFRFYRNGFLREQSKDQSLSMELVRKQRLASDKLARHQERNNLSTYAGQRRGFSPFISRKIKLMPTDCIALCTRGFWENVDDGEVLDIFKDASDQPQETVDLAEDVLLAKQPVELEKYTFVTIFVNKPFTDPNRKRKIKRVVMAAIPIVVAGIALTVVLVVLHQKKQENIASMEENFFHTMEYVLADNYVQAETACKKTVELAEKVQDSKMKEDAGNYLKLIESVLQGDESLSKGDYKTAQNHYLNALDRSRYADKLADEYVQEKLKLAADYLSVYDLIALGDTLASNLQYEEAEQNYIEARTLASKIYFDKGRESAIAALESLYAEKKDQDAKGKEQADKAAEDAVTAANLAAQGDKAFLAEDYESAHVFYLSAQQKYEELEEEANIEKMAQKISAAESKLGQVQEKRRMAEQYLTDAATFLEEGDHLEAKKNYLLAKDIYARLKDDDQVAAITRQMERMDVANNGT